jgi:twitching motility protein PilI
MARLARRTNLREFQQQLTNRILSGDTAGQRVSALGVVIGRQHWLIDMADLSEVLPVKPVTPIPISKSWVSGLINVRGNLHCVADLAAYLNLGKVSGDVTNRLLLLADSHGFNAALLVERVIGLRDASPWQVTAAGYRDEQGVEWRKLDMAGLLQQTDFLHIAA